MADAKYLKYLLLSFGLIFSFTLLSPLLMLGSAWLGCRQGGGGGCGDLGLAFLLVVAAPVSVGLSVFLAWTMVKRASWLNLPLWFVILAGLLAIGSARFALGAPFFIANLTSRAWWMVLAELVPWTLALVMAAALYWIPERSQRAAAPVATTASFVTVALVLLLRLADAIFYPLWIIPGIALLSIKLKHLSVAGPLRLVPLAAMAFAFAALLVVLLREWRRGLPARDD